MSPVCAKLSRPKIRRGGETPCPSKSITYYESYPLLDRSPIYLLPNIRGDSSQLVPDRMVRGVASSHSDSHRYMSTMFRKTEVFCDKYYRQ